MRNIIHSHLLVVICAAVLLHVVPMPPWTTVLIYGVTVGSGMCDVGLGCGGCSALPSLAVIWRAGGKVWGIVRCMRLCLGF